MNPTQTSHLYHKKDTATNFKSEELLSPEPLGSESTEELWLTNL